MVKSITGLFSVCLVMVCLLWPAWSVAREAIVTTSPSQVANPRLDGGWVSDQARVIHSYSAEINRLITNLEATTGCEIAVVTLDSIGSKVPKSFATDLFAHWGIGKKGANNGVLVLHVIDQRRVEIEVGYGLEHILTDGRTKRIIDTHTIPYFKRGAFGQGHLETVKVMVSKLEKAEASSTGVLVVDRFIAKPEGPYGKMALQLMGFGLGMWVFWMLSVLVILRRCEPMKAWEWIRAGRFLEYPSLMMFFVGLGFWYDGQSALTGGVCAPLAGMAWFWRSALLKYQRDRPRVCGDCGKDTTRESEEGDDKYLETGQLKEEEIGSMDYDAWVCECGWSRVDPYVEISAFSKCPSCNYRTYRETENKVVKAASTTTSGLRRITLSCAHCHRRRVRTEGIPQITLSSSSSSSSYSSSSSSSSSWSSGSSGGGSSSGGSWGGGSSGGGGAGGSY